MYVAFLHSQLDFGLKKIEHAKGLIAYYEAQVAEYHLLLDVHVYSEQKKKEITTQTQMKSEHLESKMRKKSLRRTLIVFAYHRLFYQFILAYFV